MKNINSKQRGFSLVEVLVALSILLIVIVGPMTMTSQIARSTSFATEQVHATFLAQEGVELVEKIRNDYFLSYFRGDIPNPWGLFTDTSGYLRHCYEGSGCGLEWQEDEILRLPISCAAGGCLLHKNSNVTARSQYTYQAGGNTPTAFSRNITIVREPASPNLVRVTSTVRWRTGTLIEAQQVEVITYLYNIYATP